MFKKIKEIVNKILWFGRIKCSSCERGELRNMYPNTEGLGSIEFYKCDKCGYETIFYN